MRDQHGDEDNTKQDKDERKTRRRRETKTKQKEDQTTRRREQSVEKWYAIRKDVCMILGLRATCYYSLLHSLLKGPERGGCSRE